MHLSMASPTRNYFPASGGKVQDHIPTYAYTGGGTWGLPLIGALYKCVQLYNSPTNTNRSLSHYNKKEQISNNSIQEKCIKKLM